MRVFNLDQRFSTDGSRPRLNFINVLCTAFTRADHRHPMYDFYGADPEIVKRYWWLSCIFSLWGSTSIKAACKILVKLTPVTGRRRFSYRSWANFFFYSIAQFTQISQKIQLWVEEFCFSKIRVSEQFGLRNNNLDNWEKIRKSNLSFVTNLNMYSNSLYLRFTSWLVSFFMILQLSN